MEDYERVLLVKQEVFVFKIPPRTTVKSYRAADWNLAEPQWSGRLRMVAKGAQCIIFLEDKVSGQQFAKCAVESYPGVSVEPVSDSSRYFVLRIQDESGRSAFIGLGFVDRSDSFDFNVALQDHFKWLKKSEEIVKEEKEPKKELNLSFKDGETIKINMKITKKEGVEGHGKAKPKSGVSCGILPPPPSCVKITPPSPVPLHTLRNQDEKEDPPSSSSSTSSVGTSNRNWVQF